MLVRELEEFRDTVAAPRMKQLLDNTEIPDGLCCIDNFELSYFNGRNYGIDSLIKASGLIFKAGNVQKYEFEQQDITVKEFFDAHRDAKFILDGNATIYNELEQTEVRSKIANLSFCAQLFPELVDMLSFERELTTMEYVKMRLLYDKNPEKQHDLLKDKISDAEARVNKSKENIDNAVNKQKFDNKYRNLDI